jgi:acetylornithine deacetylase
MVRPWIPGARESAIMTNPAINLDADRLLADLDTLLAMPSLGGTAAEVDIQRHLARQWRSEGLLVDEWDIDLEQITADPEFPGMEVARSQAVGVTATLAGSGGGRTLLINGHTDVVPPGDLGSWSADPFVPRLEQRGGIDVIVGRGACDMKAGLVAGWAAVRAIAASGIRLRGDVIIAPVVGEEDGGLGTFALLRHGVSADMCIVPEPTSLDLIPANGGALTFRLVVRGAATHASRRTEGVSAIEKFIPVMQAITAYEAERNADVDPLMARWPLAYPISIGTIHAGDWASTVPDLLTAEGRLGVALDESVDDARSRLEAAVAAACSLDPWLRDHPVEVQWWGGQFASGRTDLDHPVITELGAVHRELTGTDPLIYGGPYGSDLRLLSGLGGIPTVQYGPGDAARAHAPDEYVPVDEVITCARALIQMILRTCA